MAHKVVTTRLTIPLTIRDLHAEDLSGCAWAGDGAAHLRAIAAALGRVTAGSVDYLAVCGPADLPVGIGGVDFGRRPEVGLLWQLEVHPILRRSGIATALIGALEDRIRARGLGRAELGVEESNQGARRLYERLGYRAFRHEDEEWDAETPDGRIVRYRAHCTVMAREL
jgi:ribosomal protein S18 acetylase RimI-like enzyme